MAKEKEALEKFFKQKIEVPPLPLSEEDLKKWQDLGLEPHYLPKIELREENFYPGWFEKPSPIFYKKIKEEKLDKNAAWLPGKWILIESREKPKKSFLWISSSSPIILLGKVFGFDLRKHFKKLKSQQYPDDFLLPILKKFGFESRFCLSLDEIRKLYPEIAQLLKIKKEQIRLPYFIEWNFLTNLFYPQWKKTSTLRQGSGLMLSKVEASTWEHLEDSFNKNFHLATGSNSSTICGWDKNDYWSTILGFRLVIEILQTF